jgi:hypothetical protein
MASWGGAARAEGDVPKVGGVLLGGVLLPRCGPAETCAGSFGASPSVQARLLFEPSGALALGFAGQVARTSWRATYPPALGGSGGEVASTLTTAFFGATARVAFLPERTVTPLLEGAFGTAFQAQTGSNANCNRGVTPTVEVGLGASARASSSVSFVAVASASTGVKLEGCAVADGPPATPFAGWGWGLHLGAAFELPLGPRARS